MARKTSKTREEKTSDQERTHGRNQLAHHLGPFSTGEIDQPKVTSSAISRVMAELGQWGAKIGWKNRAASMKPERRREIALNAVQTRGEK